MEGSLSAGAAAAARSSVNSEKHTKNKKIQKNEKCYNMPASVNSIHSCVLTKNG